MKLHLSAWATTRVGDRKGRPYTTSGDRTAWATARLRPYTRQYTGAPVLLYRHFGVGRRCCFGLSKEERDRRAIMGVHKITR